MNAIAMGGLDVCVARVSAEAELGVGDGRRMYNIWRLIGLYQMSLDIEENITRVTLQMLVLK
jgi:hypothetical protein